MKRYAFKYSVDSRGREGNNNTWFLWENFRIEDGKVAWDKEHLTDHIEFHVPVITIQKEYPDFGFGMFADGRLEFRNYPNSKKQFALITSDNPIPDVESPQEAHNLKGMKYHVPSQGLMRDNTWRIYNQLNKKTQDQTNYTHDETEYVDKVEVLSRSWTGEALYRIGYSLLTDGDLYFDVDPDTGKRYAIIDVPEV